MNTASMAVQKAILDTIHNIKKHAICLCIVHKTKVRYKSRTTQL